MKSTHFACALGVEELVVALSKAGYREEAEGLMGIQGEPTRDESRGRLIAAHHSLLARDLLVPQDDEIQISDNLAYILKLLHSSKMLIRSSRSGLFGEEILSFYQDQDTWLEHRITKQVAHKFQYPLQKADVLSSMRDFFSPVGEPIASKLMVRLPETFLSMLSSSILKSVKDVVDYLQPEAGDSPGAPLLAEDLVAGQWRGSTFWIEMLDGEQVQTRGALWVQGQSRFWMISSIPVNEQPVFMAIYCPEKELSKHLKELMGS